MFWPLLLLMISFQTACSQRLAISLAWSAASVWLRGKVIGMGGSRTREEAIRSTASRMKGVRTSRVLTRYSLGMRTGLVMSNRGRTSEM